MKREIMVAYGNNREIGGDGKLLWRMPNDMLKFRAMTMGETVIMGRKTYESIGHALPGRENIVVSRTQLDFPDAIAVGSLKKAFKVASRRPYVIGGEQIYTQAIDMVDIIRATEIRGDFPTADSFFPALGSDWKESYRLRFKKDDKNPYDFDFVTYTRK